MKLNLSVSFIFLSFLYSFSSFAELKFDGSASPLLHATPKSLADLNISKSTYPNEAELYCGTDQCIFGLSRGLVVGGDLAGTLYAPLRQYLDPYWVSGGGFTFIDIFGGFQILRDVNAKINMNSQIGFRKISFNDGVNTLSTQGLTTEIHFSQSITSVYLQNLEFSAYLSMGSTKLNNSAALNINSNGHNKLTNSARYFYRISNNYPTYKLFLPADFELLNWSADETKLDMPLHSYIEIAPFYIQNNLNINENNISLQKTEQNFGTRVAIIGSYESNNVQTKSGRYSLKSELGVDISSSQFSTSSSGNADLDLPKRQPIAPYIELAASWQF